MSVYKRPGAEVYSYDFRWRGHRFHGSTGCGNKRDAEKWEKAERDRLKASQIDTTKPMTFGAATTKFWEEVGQHRSKPLAMWSILGWLQRNIGSSKPIREIDDALVAKLVAKKRGDTRKARRGGKVDMIHVAPATVNRNMLEPLRAILNRASEFWGQSIGKVAWEKHRLKEPQERVREASIVEEAEIMALVPESYRPAVAFAILTGCRRGEIIGLTWQDVNFFARDLRVTGKGDKSRTIPMSQEVFDLLWSLRGHHDESVFTYVEKLGRMGRAKGSRYPITKAGLGNAWGRSVRGKIANFTFHDTRHTAATRLVRQTGSIKLAQKLLGHSNITTTTRYAHVTHDDLRNGLEAVSAAKSATQTPTDSATMSPEPLHGKASNE